jgi:hypothetical protein
VLCAAGFNIRWLMRAIVAQAAKAAKAFFFGLLWLVNLLQIEPPRVLRRLQLVRRWSHEQVTEVFARGPGACREDGAGATR